MKLITSWRYDRKSLYYYYTSMITLCKFIQTCNFDTYTCMHTCQINYIM